MSETSARLPSLDLIKSFVAVGRRLSITEAARELCLTQSAVSRQIIALEDALGCPLLVRGHRSLAFTAEGERLFRETEKALRRIQDAVEQVRPARRPVSITASIGVSTLWLLPRLGDFQQSHPEIDVRVTALNRVVDLDREGVDLSIRYGRAADVPAGAEKLFNERLGIVAHPALGIARIAGPADLANQVLLEYDDARMPWLQWDASLASLGWPGLHPRGMPRFNQYDQAILAALAGQGLALGRLPLLNRQLAAGLLRIVPTPGPLPTTDYAYWLLTGEGANRPAVATVAAWIREEAGEQAGAR
jgi:DNA-binding transcriptional LysR family regulator